MFAVWSVAVVPFSENNIMWGKAPPATNPSGQPNADILSRYSQCVAASCRQFAIHNVATFRFLNLHAMNTTKRDWFMLIPISCSLGNFL